jgi:magnesium-transporting ATPase (P-type)
MALAILYGLVIGGLTLTAFLYSPVKHLTDAGMAINLSGIKLMLENPDILVHAQTYAFVTLAMSQLFHAFGMRDTEHSIFQQGDAAGLCDRPGPSGGRDRNPLPLPGVWHCCPLYDRVAGAGCFRLCTSAGSRDCGFGQKSGETLTSFPFLLEIPDR